MKRTVLIFPLLFAATTANPANPLKNGWRSALYPQDWTPTFTALNGNFLHDFSYAGYHNGETPIPESPPGETYDVVTQFGARNDGSKDATFAFQNAVNAAENAGGGVVFVPAGRYRFDGALAIKKSGVVIRGDGPGKTFLRFTGSEGLDGKAGITFAGASRYANETPLAQEGTPRSKTVYVAGAHGLSVGDDVAVGWVITPEFVAEHGMTKYWTAHFSGSWKPFFRRKIVAIDESVSPVMVTLDVPLRYRAQLRDKASLRRETGYLSECGIENLAIANAVDHDTAWKQNGVGLVTLENVKDCWVRGIRTFAPAELQFPGDVPAEKGFHIQSKGIRVISSKRVTIADTRIERPQNIYENGNGYLFEISRSNEILIRDSVGSRGRHNFIQNWDFGTNGCVWLRVKSEKGRAVNGLAFGMKIRIPSFSEFHHTLAMANLIDDSDLLDGWSALNRLTMSSGAGHTCTECAFWNIRGGLGIGGLLRSDQFGNGYVIGTKNMWVLTPNHKGTAPEDFVEGRGKARTLEPQSLYEDQLKRRIHPLE